MSKGESYGSCLCLLTGWLFIGFRGPGGRMKLPYISSHEKPGLHPGRVSPLFFLKTFLWIVFFIILGSMLI